ncbi:unnamed protein product [Triticum turgidum subsp. durum]|uniref:Uncharacterized protein n=1 Tax=Triticum turgidum subsp. durum TaxID=4567 RepID=A0A9R1RTJ0_TRITD|nr:unnamed protein product [Triticum turgidum subsp. durum]
MAFAVSSTSKTIDMDKMVNSMSREVNSFWSMQDPPDAGTKTSPIYRVPQHIREIDRIAYEPIVVSFGPYNHGSQHLQAMEKSKWEHLDRVLKINCERTLNEHIKAIAGVEKQARKCYSEVIEMERKRFVQMLLLDACFLLMNIDENAGTRVSNSRILEQSSNQKAVEGGNIIGEAVTNLKEPACGVGCSTNRDHGYAMELEMSMLEANQEGRNIGVEDVNHRANMENIDPFESWLTSSAWHGVLLLENQIPFFVVECVYGLVAGQGTVESLRSKTAEFVEDIIGHYPKAIQEFNRPKHFHHLLHLCHMYFRPSEKMDEVHQYRVPMKGFFHRLLHLGHKCIPACHTPFDVEKNLEQMDCFQAGKLWSPWRRAVEYHRAGVQFKRRKWDGQSRHSLLDIRFMNGVIEVPCVPIDETTEPLFKNLIALEQTEPKFGNDFSAYVTFMSQVIATTDDATMFVKSGIIVHMMDSDEEVSALFTRITKQVVFRFDDRYYLKYLCQILEVHYQSRINRWIAWLWLNHFVNPWLGLATVAAAVVLVCTIVHTIYTVLAYVKPPDA